MVIERRVLEEIGLVARGRLDDGEGRGCLAAERKLAGHRLRYALGAVVRTLLLETLRHLPTQEKRHFAQQSITPS